MNLEPWLVVVIVGLIGALVRHAQMDGKRAQRLSSLENRMKAIDGIDANGH